MEYGLKQIIASISQGPVRKGDLMPSDSILKS